MAMLALVESEPVWRQQQRRELARDEYDRTLAERAADPENYDVPPPPGTPTTPTVPTPRTPPPSTQDPTAPVNTNPGGPGVGTGNAPGSPTTPGGRSYGTTPFTDRGSGTGHANVPYTGFDFTQDAANRLIGKSAKYTLADAVRRATESGVGDIWKTKAGAQYFAENYIKPFFEENGFEVLEIVGDKMFVRDHEDRAAGRPGSWIDWVENAGADNAKVAFQVEPRREAFGTMETRSDTSSMGTPRSIPGLTTPETTTTTTTSPTRMTPDERAYALLARREERRMSRLAERGR